MASLTSEDQAIQAICQQCFHQSLWLPANADHGKLKVTFSTTSNFEDASLQAVLFIGPMFGTRWMSLLFNQLALDCGVRMICVDRPAFGGSTAVDMDIRIKVWLETVPALLERLKLKHVSLVTHSAGAIYTLNTLLHHRSLLDPAVPFVALIAPYVPFNHSGATATSLLSHLPKGILGQTANLTTFINKNIIPSASWSGGLISSSAAFFSPSTGTAGDLPTSTSLTEQYGYDHATFKLIEKLSAAYQVEENNAGGNEEAKLCLRKCEEADWGDAADYKGCIGRIVENERSHSAASESQSRLNVRAFFAASDILVGKGGQEYFDQCWQSQNPDEVVDFATSILPGTDHDSLLVDLKKGAMRTILEQIAGIQPAAETTS